MRKIHGPKSKLRNVISLTPNARRHSILRFNHTLYYFGYFPIAMALFG